MKKYITISIIILIIIIISISNKKDKDSSITAIYTFKKGYGGIGDFIKFMNFAVEECKIKGYNFKINLDHPIKKFFKINKKYISHSPKNAIILTPFKYYGNESYIIKPIKKFNPLTYFKFSNDLWNHYNIVRKKHSLPKKYQAIHLRLGDKYFKDTDKNKHDDRINKNFKKIIYNLVTKNPNIVFIFFSDNETIKQQFQSRYKNIITIPIKIIHTSESQNNNSQVLRDNIIEFLLLSKADIIHMITHSGFPITASWLYNTKLITY